MTRSTGNAGSTVWLKNTLPLPLPHTLGLRRTLAQALPLTLTWERGVCRLSEERRDGARQTARWLGSGSGLEP